MFLIPRRMKRDIFINVHIPVFMWSARYSYRILMKHEFPRYIFEKCSYIICFGWKSVQWEASSSMRTNGRTDMTKLMAAFQNFCERAKNILDDTRKIFFYRNDFWDLIQWGATCCKLRRDASFMYGRSRFQLSRIRLQTSSRPHSNEGLIARNQEITGTCYGIFSQYSPEELK